jgi:hypothetical protein
MNNVVQVGHGSDQTLRPETDCKDSDSEAFRQSFLEIFFDAQIAEFQSVLTSEIDNATYYILNKNI